MSESLRLVILAITLIALAPWQVANAQGPARHRLIDTFSGPPVGDPEKVKAFIQEIKASIDTGADIDATDQYGNNPLLTATYWAAWSDQKSGYNDIVALLLSRGANPNIESNAATPLVFVATGVVNLKLVEILCFAGANPTAKVSPKGMSALEISRTNSFPEITTALMACATRGKQ